MMAEKVGLFCHELSSYEIVSIFSKSKDFDIYRFWLKENVAGARTRADRTRRGAGRGEGRGRRSQRPGF